MSTPHLPFIVLVTLVSAISADNVPPKCTWQLQNCPKTEPDQLNVHIICHTHDDLGWLKTVDQYYYGSKKQITEVGVQYILNTVVKELEGHPDRRFSFAETGFFWRWYMNQHDFVKHQIKKLVNNGQFEFIGGGWAQNDEAASHYVAIIDQMTLGLDKLNETFGECGKPKVAWQIDPFGHSREQASLFAQMGYEALFFSRLHYLEKEARLRNKSLEFVWNGSDDLKTNILTGAFYTDSYGPPPGFCFDNLCADDPIMDNPKMEGYNVDKKVNDFIAFVKEQASFQRTNHVMVLMGSDFTYTNADSWYSNLDKLIQYVNDQQSTAKVNLFYSTPSCYVQAVNAAGPKLPTKSDDFFPYASANHSYWTGFFSSRPTFKAFVRQSSALLQVCKHLDTNANLGAADLGNLNILMNAVALTQHHDAITGTAKENVTRDYEKRLFRGWMEGQQVINDAVAKLMPKAPETPVPQQLFCPLSNVSICNVTKTSGQFTVTVFNGQARAKNVTIRIPYYAKTATVFDFNGAAVATQVVKTFAPVYQLANTDVSPYELLIPVQVGPLGYATYFVSNKTNKRSVSKTEAAVVDLETLLIEDYIEDEMESSAEQVRDPIVLQNELIQFTFDASGLISKFTDLKNKFSVPLTQEFLWYKGYGADMNQQLSGAYIFRPNGTVPIRVTNSVTTELITGPLVNEVRQTFSPWVSQVIRLYKGKPYAEFEWTVGPIPKERSNPITKEVISRFTTNIANAGVFYTDANGRQMVTRTRNQAAMYRYENTEPVAANYYPVNSRMYIKDDHVQMTVLTDRSQGGASLVDGQLELMVHRRSFFDDGFGVGEPLDEPGVDGRGLVARGRHWLVIAPPAVSASYHRQLAYDLFYTPILTFAPLTTTVDQYRAAFNTQFDGLRLSLPDNINLLTLEQWERRSLLLRLEHIFQNGEDRDLSQPTTISLKDLFTTFDVTSVRELALGANRELKSSKEHWSRSMNRWDSRNRWREQMNVVLNPMQIRTFQIEVQRKAMSHHEE